MARFVLTAQLKLVAPSNTKQIVDQINKQLKGINATVNIKVNTKSLNNLTAQLTSASKATKKATTDIEKFGEQAALAIRRYGAFTLATGGFIKLTQAISSGVDEAIKFDRELVRVAQVTGQSLKSLKGLSDEITRLSTTFGVSSSDILKASVTLSQAGLTAKDVKQSLQALAKTGVSATFGDIQNTTEATIAIFQQFKVQAKDLENTLSSINKVSAAFAVESDDIAVAVRRAGGAFEAAGGNLNEFIALFTSVRQTTRESAESIATGFRTIFTRLQRSRTQDFFKQFGIDLRNMEGQFVGPYEAIKRISVALKNLEGTDPRFNQVVEELGGFRQVSKVVPLLTQFDVAQKALNTAVRGGSSLTEDAAAAQDALAVKIQKVKEEFADLIRTITNNGALREVINIALDLSSALIQLTKSISPLIPLLTSFGAIAIAPQLLKFGQGFKSKIFGFNKGGLVPGTGSTDSVPAMLTPGEFVLNKKTVQKFAKGGEGTEKQAQSAKDEAVANLMNQYGLTKTNAYKAYKNPGRLQAIVRKQQQANENEGNKPNFININTSKFSMIRPDVNASPFVGLDNSASAIINSRGGEPVKNAFINALGLQNSTPDEVKDTLKNTKVRGKIPVFTFNKSLSDKFDAQIEDVINSGIENFTKAAVGEGLLDPEKPPALSSLLSKSAIQSMKGSFFEGIVRRASTDFQAADSVDDEVFDFYGPGKKAGNLANVLTGTPIYPADAKAGDINTDKLSVAAKAIKHFHKKNENILGFASGGYVPGSGNTDTIPAMLTPGEFVINKKSAQSIGYGNLRKINKYNKGGAVANTTANLASNPFISFAGLAGIQVFVNNLAGANSEFSKLVNVIAQVGVRFSSFNSITESFQKNLKSRNDIGPFSERGFANSFGGKDRRASKALFRRLTSGAILSSSIAGVGGDFLSGQASSEIANGQDSTFKAASGSALSFAGTGASIGAIFGPFGAAIGGAVGAIGGFAYGLNSATKELDKARFGQKLDKLGETLDQFSKGRVSSSKITDDVVKTLEEGVNKFSSSSLDDQKDIVAAFKQNEQTIEKYFVEVAEGSADMAEFNQKTKEALVNFAVLAKIPFSSLEGVVKNSLGARAKEVEEIKKSNKLRAIEASNLENMISMMEAFEVAGNDIQKFNKQIESIFAVIGGTGLSTLGGGAGDIFKNAKAGQIGSVGVQNLVKAGRGITQSVPFAGGDELINELKDTALLFSKLPAIISTFNRQNGSKRLSDTDPQNIIAIAREQFNIKDENTLEKLGDVIKQNFLGEQDATTKLTGQFTNQFEAAEKIRNQMGKIFDIFENAAGTLEQKEALYLNAFQKQIDIENKKIDLQLESLERQQQFNEQIRELDQKPVKFGDALGTLGTRLGTAAGFGGVNTNFGSASSAIQNRILGLQNQASSLPVGSKDRIAILAEIKKEESQLRRVNRALETLVKDTSVLSAGFRELDKLGEKNKFVGGLVGTSVFGSQDEQKQLITTFSDLTNLLATKNFNVVPQDRRRDLEQFLVSAGKTDVFGTPANELLEKLVRDLITNSVGQKFAQTPEGSKRIDTLVASYIGKITPEQQKLINEMQTFINKQELNNRSVIDVLSKAPENIETSLIKANDIFLKRLESIFLQNERSKAEGEQAGINADIADLTKKLEAFKKLSNGKNISLQDAIVSGKGRVTSLNAIADDIDKNKRLRAGLAELDRLFTRLPATGDKVARSGNINQILSKNPDFEEIADEIRGLTNKKAFKDFEKLFFAKNVGGQKGDSNNLRSQAAEIQQLIDTIGTDFKSVAAIEASINKLRESNKPLEKSIKENSSKLEKLTDAINRTSGNAGKGNGGVGGVAFGVAGGVLAGVGAVANQQAEKQQKPGIAAHIGIGQAIPKKLSNKEFLEQKKQREAEIRAANKARQDAAKEALKKKGKFTGQAFPSVPPEQFGSADIIEQDLKKFKSEQALKTTERKIDADIKFMKRNSAIKDKAARSTNFPSGSSFGAPSLIQTEPLVSGLPEAPVPSEPKSAKFLAMQEQMKKNREANAIRREKIVRKINDDKLARDNFFDENGVSTEMARNRRRLAGMTRGAALNGRSGPLTNPEFRAGRRNSPTQVNVPSSRNRSSGFFDGSLDIDNFNPKALDRWVRESNLKRWEAKTDMERRQSDAWSEKKINSYRTKTFRGGVEATSPSVDKADAVIKKMNSGFDKLTTSISSMPRQIELTGNHKIEVVHNGVEVFRNMEESLMALVNSAINKSFTNFIAKNEMNQLRPPDEIA